MLESYIFLMAVNRIILLVLGTAKQAMDLTAAARTF